MIAKMNIRLVLASAAFSGLAFCGPAMAAGDGPQIEHKNWSFSGPGGHFDQNQLQRGFFVYKEVCATCHGLSRLSFRNLTQKGGPGFPEDRVKAMAEAWPTQVPDKTEAGETAVVKRDKDRRITGFSYVTRPPRLSDRIPGPYKNEAEARSIHGGAYPPDLSLIAKGRGTEYHGSVAYHPISMLRDIATGYQEGGANYLYALLTSYHEKAPAYRLEGGKLVVVPEKDITDQKAAMRCATITKGEQGKADTCNVMADTMHYNTAFPGAQIAMAAPLSDKRVPYTDGTPPTLANYAADITAFLSWAADPSHDERKRMGWQVMLYLLVTSVLLYVAKKRIWRDVH